MTDTITAGMGDEHIREAIRRHALSEAEGPYREEVQALYEMFDRHNAELFGGELRPVTITVSPPHSAKAFADARENSGWGGHQEMRVRPSVVAGEHPTGAYARTPKGGWRMRPGCRGTEGHRRWLGDLVLHEMIHLVLNQRRDPRRNDHEGHGAPFTAECNRISALLGLREVKARRRKGEPREVPISPEWPFCVRPGGMHGAYYGELWEEVAVEKAAPEEPATQGEKLLAIWGHESTTDEDRAFFTRKAGLARVDATEVMDETPAPVPATGRAIADDDGKGGRPGTPTVEDTRPAKEVVLHEPKGLPVTLVMMMPDGTVTVGEVKTSFIAILDLRRRKAVWIDHVRKRDPRAWSTRTMTMMPDPALVPLAVLRGHGLGMAALDELGRGPVGTDKDISRDDLVDRARSCGAEFLIDNLSPLMADDPTKEAGGNIDGDMGAAA